VRDLINTTDSATFDCKVTKDNSDPTAVRLDVCRDGVCTFRLSSVDRNRHTLCSKNPRDRAGVRF
jgi:hypothetical protein